MYSQVFVCPRGGGGAGGLGLGLCPGESLSGTGSLSGGYLSDPRTVTSGQYASYWNAFLFKRKINLTKSFFLLNFWRILVLFVGPLIWCALFCTSGYVCPGFQSQGGSLTCMLHCLYARNFSRFTSGATPADLLATSMTHLLTHSIIQVNQDQMWTINMLKLDQHVRPW